MATFDQIRSRFPSARNLSDNEIVAKLSDLTQLPYEDVAKRFGYTEKTSTGFLGGANDVAIEAANAAAGLVSGIGEFVSPGNRLSQAIQENIIQRGEANQSIPTTLAKRALQRGLSSSELGTQAGAVYDYVTENPLLVAGQAVGSFGPLGVAGRAAQAGSTALGLGAKAAGRVGLGTTAGVSGAAAGGDAAGDAYDLVMNTPRNVLLAHPQAQALIDSGVTDERQIYEELATRAARRASVAPAIIGAVSGATGAESALLRGVTGGARGVAKKVGTETLGEGFEEGATTYSGRKAAQEYNPAIDPMAGVYGSAMLGGVMGAGTALPIALARQLPEQNQEVDLTSAAGATQPTTAPAGFEFTGPGQRPVGPTMPSQQLGDFDPYAAIEARAAAGRPMTQAEQQQLLSSYFAAQNAGQQYIDLLSDREQTLARAQEIGQQYQSMVGRQGDQFLTAQEVGLQARPITARLQSEADAEAARIAAARQVGLGAQELPGMVKGEGTLADFRRITNPEIMQPVDVNAPEPAARASIVPSAPAPFSNIRMDRPAQEAGQPAVPITARPVSPPPGVSPSAVTPAAPVAAGASSTEVTAKAQAAIDELGLRPLLGNAASNLQASVKGGSITVGGKASYDADTLTKASEAFISEKAGKEANTKGGKLAQAAKDFGAKYLAYLNASSAMVPTESASTTRFTLKKTKKFPQVGEQAQAEARSDVYVGNVKEKWDAAQQALTTLGQAAGNNAKNVEVMIRVVKDTIQERKASLQAQLDRATETNNEENVEVELLINEIKRLEKLDQGLSSGWAAAKRGIFRNDTDVLDVRGGAIRTDKELEASGAEQPLERAAKYGERLGPNSPVQTGFMGVLNYIRGKGTPFERMIAKGVSEVFKNTSNPPQLVFDENKSQYDPNTNTITMSSKASPEVALHEALHAALQWFIYNNPKDPIVKQLLKSVDQVVKFDTKKLSPKAAAVQSVLANLTKEKRNLDAVLELVSYGNTLVEFRKALEAMPSKGTPDSFVQAAKDVWNMILATVRRMLGTKNNTAASDVIMGSFRLLQKAAETKYVAGQGQVLEAAVTSESQKAIDEKASADLEVEAKAAGYADAKDFANKQGAWKTPTQIAFEAIGFGRVNGKDLPVTASIKENGAKVAQWVRENVPTLERVTLNFNSKFSNGGLVNDAIETFKYDQNTGYLQMERISQHLHAHPELAKPFLAYMDGDAKALDGVKNSASMKAIADNLKGLMDKYIQSLPANSKERRAFEKVPFSQYLLHPDSIGQVAGTTIGVAKIGELLKTETRGEPNIDGFRQYLLEREDGSVEINEPMYQLFEEKLGNIGPAGFISKTKYEQMGAAPAGMAVDTSRVWKFSKFEQDKGVFQFESSSTAKQLAEGRKIEELTAAMLNTTAALSHTYASRNFFNGLLKIGREGDKPTARSVAFNSIDEINAAFPDRKISESNVLKVSDDASRSPQIRWRTQRTGTWVQLPENSPTYGALQGMIIPGPVWNSMIDMHDRSPLLNSRAINDVMAAFKKSKTVYNPGTHVTNVLSNVSLAILHGINFNTLGRATKMFVQFERSPNSMRPEDLALMKAFYNSGAVLGQFSSAEVKQTVYDKLNAAISPDSDSSYLTRIKTFMKYEAAKAKLKEYDSKATEFYAAEDNVFRLAAFLNTAGNIQLRDGTNKLSDKQMVESGAAARNMFLDYDIDARAIRALRQSFLPFVSWPYAAAGVLGRIAIEKPWAMANMMMSIAAIAAATGGDDDEEARKVAPDNIRERALMGLGPYMHMRVPFMGDEQNPVYFNLGKYIPMFSLFQSAPGQQKTLGMELPGFATPGGPLVSTVSALTGYDPFTGKPIAAPTDETWDRVVRTGKYLYDTMAPNLIGTRFWSQIGDLADEKTGPLGVEKSSLFLARNIGGLGLYQFNVEESRFYQDNEVKKIERDFSAAMNKAKRNEYSKGYPDYEALDAELDELQARLERRIAEIRGEE